MAYTNGLIHGNVDIRDVQRALRTSKGDIGKITTECAINQWAKYKPQDIGSQPEISEHERYLDRYGLNIPGLNVEAGSTPVEMLHHWLKQDSVAQRWWAYRRPGATDWHRYTDFDGYNARCTPVNSDPNPSGEAEHVNVMELEGEYEGSPRSVMFGLDYPTKFNNVDWPCLLNPSNLTSGGRWHFMVCLVKTNLSQIESPYGGGVQFQSMWSDAIKVIDREPISASHKGVGISWEVPYPQGAEMIYTAIYCLAEGVWQGDEFQYQGRFCPLYGNFYKQLNVSRHIDNRVEVTQIGWIANTGSQHGMQMQWFDFTDLADTAVNPRTADIFLRVRIWRANNKVGIGDVTAHAYSEKLCNGETSVRGMLAVMEAGQELPSVSAPGQASSVTIPAIGSSDYYYPVGRTWEETADYADYVWQFPNLLPNVATTNGRHSVSMQLGGQKGEAWTIFASKSFIFDSINGQMLAN